MASEEHGSGCVAELLVRLLIFCPNWLKKSSSFYRCSKIPSRLLLQWPRKRRLSCVVSSATRAMSIRTIQVGGACAFSRPKLSSDASRIRMELGKDGPEFWMPLYGASAIACAAYAVGFRLLFKLLGGIAMVVGGIRFRDTVRVPESMADLAKYYDFDTELGRETGGLTILLSWFAIMVLVDEYQTERTLKAAIGEAKRSADTVEGKKDTAPRKKMPASGSSMLEYILMGATGLVLLSTYVIPKFVMKGPAAEEHCNGLGFSSSKDS
jgi:hypothetical protein